MYPGNRRSRARRWLRWAIVCIAGFGAFIVVGLIIVTALSPQPRNNTSPPAPAPAPWNQPTSPAPSASPVLTGPVQVIPGRETVNGVSLGYPHSTVGAVSAADEYMTDLGSTLDPDRAAAVMRLIADPSYPTAQQDAATGAVNDRRDMGLPPSGPVPAGASLVVEPVEYQVRDVTPDKVTVLLLSDFITTIPGQGTQTRAAVFPLLMHWAEGDWKMLPFSTTDYSSLAVEPDSPGAAAKGWQDLEPAGG